MAELSQDTKNLISKCVIWQKSLSPKEGVSTIHVDEVASKIAVFYERIRTIIDWKEEHLMRRTAITRKLKTRFLDLELGNLSVSAGDKQAMGSIAESLVMELIRGGYFLNDKLEETKISDIQKIIEKYIFVLSNATESRKNKSETRFYNQLLEIASCEIEENLAASAREMALVDYMFEQMRKRIKVNEKIYEANLLIEEEKDIQIYIAVQRALFKFDDPMVRYNLVKYKYHWWDNPSEEELYKIAQNIRKILAGIENDLSHPLAKKFYAVCEKYDTPYLLLGDILTKDNLEKVVHEIREPSLLEGYIRSAYLKRLANLKTKIKRAAIYSTISVFVTKILSLFVLEIMIMKALKGNFDAFYLVIDVLIPTSLMFAIVTGIRPPSTKNLNLAIIEAMKIIYQKEKTDVYEIKISKKRGVITRSFLSLMYLAGAVISFSLIYWVFHYFNFPITSIVINMMFIALILFAGTTIKTKSKELTIEEESNGILDFVSDILLLPITGIGRWISNKWKQYNFVIVALNILIDVPFSIFVEFLEKWRYFIKEKKEEIR